MGEGVGILKISTLPTVDMAQVVHLFMSLAMLTSGATSYIVPLGRFAPSLTDWTLSGARPFLLLLFLFVFDGTQGLY